jgi:hypothetical protein
MIGGKKFGGLLFLVGITVFFGLSSTGCKKKSSQSGIGGGKEECPVWYKDADGDGYTDGTTEVSCKQPTGYVSKAQTGDCNDNDKNINPNTLWFKDSDKDGYTDGTTKVSCTKPSDEYVSSATSGDCNDGNSSINPGRAEICDGRDNNCDGQTDEGVLLVFYRDQDGDGYGYASNSTQACSQPAGYVSSSSDCDDNNPTLNPNTIWFKDADLDGYYPSGGSQVSCTDPYPENSTYSAIPPGDCNDTNASINPSAQDNTCDSIDNNCNLYVDENTAPCFAPTSFGIYSWGLTFVSLSWSYPSPSSNVEKFVIQRSPNGITYVDVAEASASATSHTNRVYLTSKYYFRVYAKNATGSGSPSSATSAPIGVTSLFEKTIGGSSDDRAWSIVQSSDGSYAVAGYTYSFGAGGSDFYVVKLDSAGNVQWTKTIGGSSSDYALSIIQSSDGSYAVAGYTYSFGAGGSDFYVVKLDSAGNVQWTKTIGGSSSDYALSIIQSSDGGYAVAGYTYSFGAGGWDMYVVKMGPLGDICWSQGITNYVVSSGGSFSSPSTVAFPQGPTITFVSPASGSGGSVSSVCFSAGTPPVPMCLISGGCDYYQAGSDMEKITGTMKGVEKEKEQNEIKSYGCSVGGVFSRFLIPAFMLIIYGQLRKKRKKKKV